MILRLVQVILWLAVLAVGIWLWFATQKPSSLPVLPRTGVEMNRSRPAPTLAGIDYHTQPYWVVNFFASWCVPCQAEYPLLVSLAEYAPVLGIAWKDEPLDTQAFLQKFPGVFQKVWDDQGGQYGLDWRIKGVPATYVVDVGGRIVFHRQGILEEKHIAEIMTLIQR